MTSQQIIDFIEMKFAEHGVTKLIPEQQILEQHARRLIEQRPTKKALATMHDEIARDTADVKLHRNLAAQVAAELDKNAELSWDQALGRII